MALSPSGKTFDRPWDRVSEERLPFPSISVLAAKSDEGGSLQSIAALKTEGSLWETVLGACGLHLEAQHPRLDGNGGNHSIAG